MLLSSHTFGKSYFYYITPEQKSRVRRDKEHSNNLDNSPPSRLNYV